MPVSLARINEEDVARLHLAGVADCRIGADPSETGSACLLPHVLHAWSARHWRSKPQLARSTVKAPHNKTSAPWKAARCRVNAGRAQILVYPRPAVRTQRHFTNVLLFLPCRYLNDTPQQFIRWCRCLGWREISSPEQGGPGCGPDRAVNG